MNATRNAEKAVTDSATQALRDYSDELNLLLDVQNSAERADIALERAKMRLTDAQKAVTEAAKKYGEKSPEYQEAVLNLRDADLDLYDAEQRVAEAADKVNEELGKIPRPDTDNMLEWLNWYQQIGDKANYAALKAKLASGAISASTGAARSGTGGYNIPMYGSGGKVTKPHLAVVGDEAEYIINPKESNAYALMSELASDMGLGGGPAVTPTASIASRAVTIAPGAISVKVVLQSGSHADAVAAADTISEQILLRLATGVA
jgi:hypothetical protein